jgi:hypothetical protein
MTEEQSISSVLKGHIYLYPSKLTIYYDKGYIYANIKPELDIEAYPICRTDSLGSFFNPKKKKIYTYDITISSSLLNNEEVLLEGKDGLLYLDGKEIGDWIELSFSKKLFNQSFEKIRISNSYFHSHLRK